MLDRRRFLLAAGSAVAALGTPALAHAPAAQPETPASPPMPPARKRDIKKAVKYGMIEPGSTVLDKFRLLRSIGFEGVEMDSPNDLPLEEVLAARAETGLEIPSVVDSVHWHKPLGDPDPGVRAEGVKALESAIRDAKAYGATTVLLVPAIVDQGVAYADAYQRSQDEVRKVLPLCKETGVRIAIENVWNNFLLSPLEAARYTDEIDPVWVGWHFDIGNVVAYGWPEHWIRALGKRIWKLDVKEYSRRKRDEEGRWKGFEVAIGDGDCGWPRVMAALDEVGYSGWAAAEVPGGDEARLREIRERMERVLSM